MKNKLDVFEKLGNFKHAKNFFFLGKIAFFFICLHIFTNSISRAGNGVNHAKQEY